MSLRKRFILFYDRYDVYGDGNYNDDVDGRHITLNIVIDD